MKIKSFDFNLDMRLTFKGKKSSGNAYALTDDNNKLKHGKVCSVTYDALYKSS